MKKIATFSNGHTDEYKGRRDVKAAWMLVLPCGKIVSGHSMDKATAEKTARSNPHYMGKVSLPSAKDIKYAHIIAYWNKVARNAGFSSLKEYISAKKSERQAFQAQCKIEVVEI